MVPTLKRVGFFPMHSFFALGLYLEIIEIMVKKPNFITNAFYLLGIILIVIYTFFYI